MRTLGPVLILLGAVTVAAAQPSAPLREQRERELALVRHIHRHIVRPGDGLALAADRRDLERARVGASPAGTPTQALSVRGASDLDLLDRLSVALDIWYARIVERTPFHLMPRDRLERLGRADQAIGQLQSRASSADRDRFLPEMREELQALTRFASGQGEVPEAAIDLALGLADQASTGRPVVGPYPVAPAGPAGPGAAYPPVNPAPGSPGPPSLIPPPGAMPPPVPPPSSGPAPYTLPPGYANYVPGSAAVATATTSACQLLRQSAGASGSVNDMLRAAECWTRLQAWPGWGAQSLEALDWAATYARLDRDCAMLGEVIARLRELGRPIAATGEGADVAALADRAEFDRRLLRAGGRCR